MNQSNRSGAVAAMLSLLVLVGCGEDADRPSDVHSLRVLAVRAETPFGSPGATAELSMLAFDGSPRARSSDGSVRETSTLWIGGCINPAGDNYAACMPYLHAVIANLSEESLATRAVPAQAPAGVLGWGEKFTAQIPADIIASRALAAGVVNPYGLEMVFFAHCGGVLHRNGATSSAFPLGCFDAQTGAVLGSDDFEYGFYPLFVYDGLKNANPALTAVHFEENDVGVSCSDADPCADGMHCGSSGNCIPVVDRCNSSDADDCESHAFSVEVPRSSVEAATVAHVAAANAGPETLWVSYYANAGSFEQDARIINDPHSGWSDDIGGKWRAHVGASREVRLWAVVRDSRNGVAWEQRDVWVE